MVWEIVSVAPHIPKLLRWIGMNSQLRIPSALTTERASDTRRTRVFCPRYTAVN
jgi:hypothetical protein